LYENYTSPWLDDELQILQEACVRFFRQEFVPLNDKWIEQGKVDLEA
jgi:acyl-CoA dehydrogenase|tara:strand:+ start:1865 stop:2005 length:141 start_codon:yes stop_codon:yes gene_type:complete